MKFKVMTASYARQDQAAGGVKHVVEIATRPYTPEEAAVAQGESTDGGNATGETVAKAAVEFARGWLHALFTAPGAPPFDEEAFELAVRAYSDAIGARASATEAPTS
jgi:hypothetical protein